MITPIQVRSFVEIVRDNHYAGSTGHHVCTGQVVRSTPCQWVVLNEHGNESRFDKFTLKQLGSAEPRDNTRIMLAREPQLIALQVRFDKYGISPGITVHRNAMKEMRADLNDRLYRPTIAPQVSVDLRTDLRRMA